MKLGYFIGMAAITLIVSFPVAAQKRKTGSAAPRPAARATSQKFEDLKTRADQARESGSLVQAIPLYRQALAVQPNWTEGWWYLATLLYDRDEYAEAARAFRQTSILQPKVGTPLVMLGLCEFRLSDYDNALKHITEGRKVGVSDNPEISQVMRYHEGLLLLLKGDFESAESRFNALSYENVNSEDLIMAHGLASLRLSLIPAKVPADYRDRDLIRRAGFAAHLVGQINMADAQNEYDRLVADYPKSANVQYAYGKYLLKQRNDDGAIAAFEKEIENSPNHALARLQLAYIRLRNKEPEAGLKLAQEAVVLNPRQPQGHYILGRIFFDLGQNQKAISELEVARRMAPNEPRFHFALSRAYDKAGRKAEAEIARETFTRLNKQIEDARTQGAQRGEVIEETPEKPKPEGNRQD